MRDTWDSIVSFLSNGYHDLKGFVLLIFSTLYIISLHCLKVDRGVGSGYEGDFYSNNNMKLIDFLFTL